MNLDDIVKIILVRVDTNIFNVYFYFNTIITGYSVNLSITQIFSGSSSIKTFNVDSNIIENLEIVVDDFDLSVNYSYGNIVSNNFVRSGFDKNDFNIVYDIDLENDLYYNYNMDEIEINGLDKVLNVFEGSNLATDTSLIEKNIFLLSKDTKSLTLLLYANDSVNDTFGIASVISNLSISNIKEKAHWKELIQSEINIKGFEEVSILAIENIFNELKEQRTFSLVKSNFNDYKWLVDKAKNYILDVPHFAVRDTSNNIVNNFINYNHGFNLDVKLDGNYLITGQWVNKYLLLSKLWDIRVKNRVGYVNSNVGSVKINLEQEFNHCVKMRNYYNGLVVRKLSW